MSYPDPDLVPAATTDRTPKDTDADPNATEEHVPRSAGTPATADDGRSHSVFPAIPGYEVESELGRGGMGVVYRARQTDLNRPVAIKMILGGKYTDPVAQARFLVEAEVIAAIQHPHIVQVFEFGRHDDQPFFVLEFVGGGSLARKLKSAGRFTPREAALMVSKLADAMAAAHQKGVIHRDLKPANVLLMESGEPKVTDFGLAKTGQSDITASGAIMGTPSYMSPEQAAGKARDVGTPTDVYALGAILYALTTGRPPFKDDSPMATIQQVLTKEPERPRTTDPKIPLDLETICLKCLEKDAKKRYATAAELGMELHAFLEGRPISARPVGLVERTWKWAKRNPAWASGIAAGLMLLIVATIAGLAIREQVIEQQNASYAAGLVKRLLDAETAQVPAIVKEISDYRKWADSLLSQENDKAALQSRQKLHASLALLPVDERHLDYLYGRLLEAEPNEVLVIRDALAPYKDQLADKLWAVVESPAHGKEAQRLRAAAALATYQPENVKWTKAHEAVGNDLVAVPSVYLATWKELFRPVRDSLLLPLAVVFRNSAQSEIERNLATEILADYASDRLAPLANLVLDAEPKPFVTLFPVLAKHGKSAVAPLVAELAKKPPPPVTDKEILKKTTVITADDAKVNDMRAKVFEVELRVGAMYKIEMASNVIDSFLVLQDSSGKELGNDDDSGGGLDGMLEFTPPRNGIYKVLAASLPNPQRKPVGEFVLTVTEVAGAGDSHLAQTALARRQANAGVGLLRLGEMEAVWPLLKHSPDPTVRSWLIHRFGSMGADAKAIVQRLDLEPDLSIRRALILSLGEFDGGGVGKPAPSAGLSPVERATLLKKLQDIYRSAEDPGLHAAAEWLLRHWKETDWLTQTTVAWAKDKTHRDNRLASRGASAPGLKHASSPSWYVNCQGQTMVMITGPVEFRMGSPTTEPDRGADESRHKRRIGRSFAIAAAPVTKEQFLRFLPGFTHAEMKRCPEPSCPIGGVNWYDAAAYCNWLSKQEGIAEDQWCYEANPKGQVVKLRANYLSLTGYRLPTEAEWEYACRANTESSRSYGGPEELLGNYGWYLKNSADRSWPVGSKKPNDLGLFDMHGNMWNWCQERYRPHPAGAGAKLLDDIEDSLVINPQEDRVLRGGSFNDLASVVNSANRNGDIPSFRGGNNGFRVSRTLPLDGSTVFRHSGDGGRKQ